MLSIYCDPEHYILNKNKDTDNHGYVYDPLFPVSDVLF
jgi:hypothetical protein